MSYVLCKKIHSAESTSPHVVFLFSGVHTSQLMYGCELDDDGNKRGYYQYGYYGEDFLSLDKSSHTWTAANPQAFTTKIKWDSTKAHAEFQNNYLSNTCIEWLKKYVNYGKDTLDRKGWNISSFDYHYIVSTHHNNLYLFTKI